MTTATATRPPTAPPFGMTPKELEFVRLALLIEETPIDHLDREVVLCLNPAVGQSLWYPVSALRDSLPDADMREQLSDTSLFIGERDGWLFLALGEKAPQRPYLSTRKQFARLAASVPSERD